MKKPIVLCILDGVGIASDSSSNAVSLAKTPTLDHLLSKYPNSKLACSGIDVGLPENQMGNSEVGHLNIGAGRIVYQSLTLINKAIDDLSFYKNDKFLEAIEYAKTNNKKLHLMGLLSDGGVHSHIRHLKSLLKLAKENDMKEVYVHAFLDGRDTSRNSAINFIQEILDYMKEIDCGQLATISGRYYAMDRDTRFERNYEAYKAMVLKTSNSYTNPIEYVQASYDNEVFDEFVMPAYQENVNGQIEDEDAVIFINFRPDRAIQIASLLTNPNYVKVFEKQPKNLKFICMMKYDQSVLGEVAFEHENLNNMVGPYLASLNKKQLRIAETEKYAHVTFFLDGQVKYDGVNNAELEGCTRILVPSPKVATYDLQPEMSAFEVRDKLLAELDKNYLDLVILNFANGDMVGHTGSLEASIKAVEAVDSCLDDIYKKVSSLNGVLIITADHGNCEAMLDENNKISTTHTTNEVMFVVTDTSVKLENGRLSDIVPTILEMMEVEKPKEMTGKSLIIGG